VRWSLGYYNTIAQVDEALAALETIARG